MEGIFKSKTMGFAGILVATGLLDQFTNLIPMLVPEGYRGIAVAAVGLIVAVLRKATTQPLEDK